MIGGHDISFVVEAAAEVMEGSIRLATAFWPQGVIEDAASAELLKRDSVIRQLPQEVLVYKDNASRESWMRNGAIPENANSMIHLIRGPDSLTLVVDDPEEVAMRTLIAAIRDHVRQDIFWLRAAA